jgi:hypothetical protein
MCTKIQISLSQEVEPGQLEAVVDTDLKEFEEFFRTRVENSSLTSPERAILKTYLWYKLHPK